MSDVPVSLFFFLSEDQTKNTENQSVGRVCVGFVSANSGGNRVTTWLFKVKRLRVIGPIEKNTGDLRSMEGPWLDTKCKNLFRFHVWHVV